jgi:hypothetical protein
MLRRFLLGPCLTLAATVIVLATGCAEQVGGGGGGGGGANNPPPGVVDDTAGFYVRYVTNGKYTYDLHAGATGFNTPCTASKNQSVDCYLDAEELDLYFHGVTLQYNVPSTLCTYLRFRSYYFVRYPVETSPTLVNVDTDRFGRICHDANSNGTCEVGEEDQRCAYDYSGNGGPNCCEGRYTQVSRGWNSVDNVYGDPVVTELTYGGKYGNCLDGPATQTHPKDSSNVPLGILSFVEGTGLNELYEIKSPIAQGHRSNAFIANFFSPLDHGGGTPAGLTPTSAVVPEPMFRWQCLDRSDDVIAEIKLFIREWNTKVMFDNRVANPTGYDETGPEDSPFGPVNMKNDRFDWRDWNTVYPGRAL